MILYKLNTIGEKSLTHPIDNSNKGTKINLLITKKYKILNK